MNPVDAVDNPRGVFKPLNYGMETAAPRVLLDVEIRVVDICIDTPVERSAEQRRKSEIGAPHAPLVVERGLIGRDEVSATLNELDEPPALFRRERGDVRQNERTILADVVRIEQVIVRHVERHARFHESLVKPERVIFN